MSTLLRPAAKLAWPSRFTGRVLMLEPAALMLSVEPVGIFVLPLPLMLPPVQFKAVANVILPAPPRVPLNVTSAANVEALATESEPTMFIATALLRLLTDWAPVTVIVRGLVVMTASSAPPGSVPLDQLFASDQ